MDGFPDLSDHLLVLLYGCVLPFVSGVKSAEAMEGVVLAQRDKRRFYLANGLFLLASAIPVAVSWALHGRPFEEMGFRGIWLKDAYLPVFWALTSVLLLLYAVDLAWNLRAVRRDPAAAREFEEKVPFLPGSVADLPAYLFMCLSAAFSEELIYRGFMVAYFRPELNGREGLPYLAVLAPAVLFSLAHLYQGWQAVGKILLLSVLLACIFLVSGSLWPVILIHLLIDVASGVASMAMMKRMGNRDTGVLPSGTSVEE